MYVFKFFEKSKPLFGGVNNGTGAFSFFSFFCIKD